MPGENWCLAPVSPYKIADWCHRHPPINNRLHDSFIFVLVQLFCSFRVQVGSFCSHPPLLPDSPSLWNLLFVFVKNTQSSWHTNHTGIKMINLSFYVFLHHMPALANNREDVKVPLASFVPTFWPLIMLEADILEDMPEYLLCQLTQLCEQSFGRCQAFVWHFSIL